MSSLVSTIAWLVAVATMIAVLVLRITERRASQTPQTTYEVKDLEISPQKIRLGNQATVAVTVSNRGQHAGTFKISLKVDGITRGEREITIARGNSDRVVFSVSAEEPGPVTVDVGGLAGIINVTPA